MYKCYIETCLTFRVSVLLLAVGEGSGEKFSCSLAVKLAFVWIINHQTVANKQYGKITASKCPEETAEFE